jgi:hypothetical protein
VGGRGTAELRGEGGEVGQGGRSPISGSREIAAPLLGRALRGAEALRARRPSRDEAELAGRGGAAGEAAALIEGEQAPVEALAHLHAGAGVGAAARPGRDLQPAVAKADGIVAATVRR